MGVSTNTIGNLLLAMQMTQSMPQAALYTPLRLVVYEDEQGDTFSAHDSFVSLMAQYQREEITHVARLIKQTLEALVAEVAAAGGGVLLTLCAARKDERMTQQGKETNQGVPRPLPLDS